MSISSCWLRWCVAGVVLFASMWTYVFIAWPSLTANPLSDLYPRWYGSRELLLRGRNPYSPEVTREIQEWLRGRPAREGEDEGRFAYPVYVAFVLSPTVAFDFSAVNRVMFWVLLACAGASAITFLKFVNWQVSARGTALALLFSLGSFAATFGVRVEQLALLVALLLGASLAALAADWLAAAGVLLAVATIKPQLTVLLVPWLLAWSVGDWRRRRRFFWSFLATMAVLVSGSEILVRNWIAQFIQAATAYTSYTDGRSVLMVLFSRTGGIAVSVLLLGGLAWLCLKFFRSAANTAGFVFCSAVVLAATLVVIPTIAPHGQLLLLPGIFLLIRHRNAIWNGGRGCRHALMAGCAVLAWPSILALGLCLGALWYGPGLIHRFWLLPVGGTPLLPVAVTVALLVAKRQILSSGEGMPELGSAAQREPFETVPQTHL